MRFSLAVAVVLVGMSLSGWAQQNNEFKVKNTPAKAPKRASSGKTTTGPTASTPTRPAGTTRKGPALKSARNKPNPPINFGGAGGKSAGTNQGANPYKGRLRQKGHH
jgi:hypothetical protein